MNNTSFTLKVGQIWTGAPPRHEKRGIDEVNETHVSFHKQTSKRRFLTYQTTTIMGFRKWIQQSQAISNDGQDTASMHGFSPSREIGQRIQLLRKAAGLSQQQLADLLGVSRTAVGFWETGRPNKISKHVPRLAKIFGISEEVFLNGQSNERTEISITKDETHIINIYRSLSIDHRLQAIKRMEMLLKSQ
ncbi:helix-turn-helix domain-containing protein [Komagataeibacter swingsii]|uniref:Helix-turn-helix domain-containing protein n=1 Tax=Komagataeibacter swingsii TaxID=215220 RepID=A0A850P9J3_9PROT|nr:helix-turn-helix transcriptional regulator [Komagataeibacter swingsii]NVN38552.1 helix-turn-helix domain-containing protein [Komagataeibacter swingsii]